MTEPESKKPPAEGEVAAAEVAGAEPPAPEPWTPRRVAEWNAYYDLYVAGFVVLLALLGSVNKISPLNSGLWSLLQAGRQIAATGAPVVSDTISTAGEGRRWANIPWLFELAHYELHATVAALAPPPEPGSATPVAAGPAVQYGAGALIVLNALVRGLTAFLLMGLRRKGPGLWWAALCTTLALGVSVGPATVESLAPAADASGELVRTFRPTLDLSPGGIAGPALVAPETWGLLFLAVELLLLHQAINQGKAGRIYGLIPLFLLWANVNESSAFGLVILAATVIGLRGPRVGDPDPPPLRTGLIVLAASFAATFASPSHVHGVLVAFAPIYRSLWLDFGPPGPVPLSVFGGTFRATSGAELARVFQIYYAAVVCAGLLSFSLNHRRFSTGRFLAFVAAAALWAMAMNFFTPMFAAVFAATLALNGQEWYHDTIGTEGRLGPGWVAWSTGGRLVTIALVSLAIASGVTGRGRQVGESQFGLGFNPDDFPFEAAEGLKNSPIAGNILNTTPAQGDAIAWLDSGKRKDFLDSRQHLYPPETVAQFRALRESIRDDEIARWQPVLDQYGISAVMVQPAEAPKTYARLISSPHWILFYDDGAVTMFGRADAKAPAGDLAFFKENRLDAEALAYRRPRPVPPWMRPPTATYEPIDAIFQNRLLNRPQPHTEAARRWLRPADVPPGASYLPDPAHCLMAIREARTALSIKPDDTTAFRWLFEAYRLLLAQESALIAGIPLTTENIPRILEIPPQGRFLANRFRQALTALNFTIQTLPPARTAAERVDKLNLNYTLAQFYMQAGALDLARERLTAIEAREGEMNEDFFKRLTLQLGELNQRVEQIQNQLNDLVINQRATPMDKANVARSQGAPGLAIHELEELNDAAGNPAAVRPALVNLYCETGQPEKALDVIGNLNVDDPSLSSGIGTASYRQGMVYFLLGNYENAVSLWRDKSIAQIRTQRSLMAPAAGQMLLQGEAVAATRMFLEIPEKVNQQAQWEFELALAAMEGGLPPDLAADHLQTALKLEPALTVRPLIAYYLEKLGKPVPPPPAPKAPAAAPAPSPTPIPAETSKPELPADPFLPGGKP